MILIGVIPEPKGDNNSYLSPLVKELDILYRGVTLNESNLVPSHFVLFSLVSDLIYLLPGRFVDFSHIVLNLGVLSA